MIQPLLFAWSITQENIFCFGSQYSIEKKNLDCIKQFLLLLQLHIFYFAFVRLVNIRKCNNLLKSLINFFGISQA